MACPIPDCTAEVKPHQLMCLGHWKMVPQGLARKVNATWKNYHRDAESYREAREAAIEAVKAKAGAERTLL